MKKTYMQPDTQVMKIELTKMVATSTLGYGDPVSDASGAEGRLWDDSNSFFDE